MQPSPSKAASSSSIARKNTAFVDIPPAPYDTPRRSIDDYSMSSSKENSPQRLNRSKLMRSDTDDVSAVRKRKISESSSKIAEQSTRIERGAKKSRLSVPSAPGDQSKEEVHDVKVDSMTEEPVFYCHQCNKKRALSSGIQCTKKSSSSRAPDRRCGAKYCRNCLRNRYNEDMDHMKSGTTRTLTKKEREQHTLQGEYYYECPRCKGVCNCRTCRKAQGLEPTGKFQRLPSQQSRTPASEKQKQQTTAPAKALAKGSTATPTSRPKARIMKETATRASRAGVRKTNKASQDVTRARKPRSSKAKPAVQPKPLPKPVWTRIDTSLDQSAAEARIHIREFVQRFSSVLDMGKTHLDELEEITGTTGEHGARVGDDDDDDDDDEVEGWVSEPCVKAIILALLTIVANSADNDAIIRAAKGPISDVRASGANLNKIWVALARLRDGLRRVPSSPFQYPDPLPPPANIIYRTTRHTHQADPDLFVGNSAQLVPVVSALVESALHTKAVREELDCGPEHEKNLTKDVREEINRQKAYWDELRVKEKGAKKTEKEQHKQALQNIEHAHRIASSNHILRYAPLGQDHEGRVYYLLTPSEAEREAALQLIAGKDSKVKMNRRRGGLTEEDRREMRRWSWCVAVWGKLPEGAVTSEAEDSTDEDASDEERWWGFYDPVEIRKMAEWVGINCELSDAMSKRRYHVGEDSRTSGVDDMMLERAVFGSSPSSSRAPSPMSDLSSDDEGEESGRNDEKEEELSAYMRTDAQGRPVPTNRQLRVLVDGLREYADLLQWRISRISGESAVVEKTTAVNGAIPAKKFYS